MLKETPYQNIGTFLKARSGIDACKMGVVGITYDGSTSFRPGARLGPQAIREASAMLTDGHHPRYGVDPAQDLIDFGDIVTGNDYASSIEDISSWYAASSLVSKRKPIFALGGDHSITAGILAGLKRAGKLPKDTCLFIADAHGDCWADDFGLPRGHGTWVRNVVEDGLINPKNVMQIGVRSPADPATEKWLRSQGGLVYDPDMAESNEDNYICTEVCAFTQRRGPLYISIDIDVLDPAFAPGTGTPECGGLSTMSLLRILREIDTRRLIGADLVEVNPAYDPTKITALAGATIIYTLMSSYLHQTGVAA